MKRSIETHIITWRGITIEVRYEAAWLGSTGPYSTAHLEVAALAPERAPLPITETGYRSHFANREGIGEVGGPVEFVTAWLDHSATKTRWKEQEESARQLTLF